MRYKMNIQNLFNKYFKYNPQNHYQFTIPDEKSSSDFNNEPKIQENNKKQNLNKSLQTNLEYLKTKYNTMINSDIVIRQFTLNARNKQFNAFIAYIDGMVDSKIINDFILQPLMMRNKNNLFEGAQNKIISERVENDITIRKVKKFDLPNYLMGCLLPQNSIKEVKNFDEVCNGVNSRKLRIVYRNFSDCF